MTRKTRDDILQRFADRYARGESAAMAIVERQVIGANVGANGYTTVAQADRLIGTLALTPRTRLLDLGSGRGWPGLYLAARTGCSAVLSDVPASAVAIAAKRARRSAEAPHVAVVRASAVHPPFAARSFDAISHTDTL